MELVELVGGGQKSDELMLLHCSSYRHFLHLVPCVFEYTNSLHAIFNLFHTKT